MTAEIAVMNQQGVALAADSAVTVTSEHGVKIFASANKIFALSKYEPVGVMVYGSASLLGMPWESIIKQYREELGRECFSTIQDQAADFLTWLGGTAMFTGEMKRGFVLAHCRSSLLAIRTLVSDDIAAIIEDQGKANQEQVRDVVKRRISAFRGFVNTTDERPHSAGFERTLRETYRDDLAALVRHVFEELPLSSAQRGSLARLSLAPLIRVMTPDASGLVVAGFGRDDYLPSLRSFMIDGVALNQAIFNIDREMDISTRLEEAAYVSGFAQSDVIYQFMEGVAPNYEEFVENYLGGILDSFGEALAEGLGEDTDAVEAALRDARETMATEVPKALNAHRYENYVEPVLDVVRSLPKDELAALADSLVNLTSLKRRVSRDDETVGGPVDVAVISKGDGLIWIQRKHYFDVALNQHFLANYYRRGNDGQTADE